MPTKGKVVLGLIAIGGAVWGLVALGRRASAQPPQPKPIPAPLPGMAKLDIKTDKPAGMLNSVSLYLGGVKVGNDAAIRDVTPGTYRVSFEDIDSAHFTVPAPITVTVMAGEIKTVVGKFTAIVAPLSQFELRSFFLPGTMEPGKTYQGTLQVKNPGTVTTSYRVYFYGGKPVVANPDPVDPIIGSIVQFLDLAKVPPGTWSYSFNFVAPVNGFYELWLRIYDINQLQKRFLSLVYSGQSIIVAPPTPTPAPAPTNALPADIAATLGSVGPLVDQIRVQRPAGSTMNYSWDKSANPVLNNLLQIQVGDGVQIHVTSFASIVVQGITYASNSGGWILVPAWPSAAPPFTLPTLMAWRYPSGGLVLRYVLPADLTRAKAAGWWVAVINRDYAPGDEEGVPGWMPGDWGYL